MPPEFDGERYTVRSVMNDPSQTEPKRKNVRTPLEQAKKWAMDYLKRPHSEKEVRTKLREKGASDADIETVVGLCVDYGFINDAEYAGMIVRHYAAGGYGPGRIRAEMNRRGVPRELWDEAMTEFPEDTETIDRLLAARLRGRDASDRKERDKTANALFRKGYDWADIRAALERYGAEGEDD